MNEPTEIVYPSDVTERQRNAHKLRSEGMKFRQIGKELGVTANRARDLYGSAERKIRYAAWRAEQEKLSADSLLHLHYRTNELLDRLGLKDKASVRAAFIAGTLHPRRARKRGYGFVKYRELAKFLGLEPAPLRQLHTCPHCGTTF